MIPITIRGSYDIQLKNNLFTIPLFLGAGITLTSPTRTASMWR